MAAAASDAAWRATEPHFLPPRTSSSAAASMWSSARMTPTSSTHDSHASKTSTDATVASAHAASPSLAVVPATPPKAKAKAPAPAPASTPAPAPATATATAPAPTPTATRPPASSAPTSPSRPVPLTQQPRRKSATRLLSSILPTSLSAMILPLGSDGDAVPPPEPGQSEQSPALSPAAAPDSIAPPVLRPLTPLAPLTLTPTGSLDEHRAEVPASSPSSRDRCLPPLANASSPVQYHLPHPTQPRSHPEPALLAIGPSPASSQLSFDSDWTAGLSIPTVGTQSFGALVEAIQANSTGAPRGQSAPVSLSASAETSTATLAPVTQVSSTPAHSVPSSSNSSSTTTPATSRRERLRSRNSVLRSRSLLRSLNMSPAVEPASQQTDDQARGKSVDSAKLARSKSRTRSRTPSDAGQSPKQPEMSRRVSLSRSASVLSETLRARLQRKRSSSTAPDRAESSALPGVVDAPGVPVVEEPHRRTLQRGGGPAKRTGSLAFPTIDPEAPSSGTTDECLLPSVARGSARSAHAQLVRPRGKNGSMSGLQDSAEPASDGDRDAISGTSPESEDVATPEPPSRRTSISGRKEEKRGNLMRASTGGLLTRSVQTMLDLHTRRNSLTSRPAAEASFVRTHAHRGHRAEVSPFESAFAETLQARPGMTIQTQHLQALSPLSPDSPSTAFRIADDLEFLHALEDVRRHHRESRRVSWDVPSASAPIRSRTRGNDRNSAPPLPLTRGSAPSPAVRSAAKTSGHSHSASCTIPTRYKDLSEMSSAYTANGGRRPSMPPSGTGPSSSGGAADRSRRRALSWTGDVGSLLDERRAEQTTTLAETEMERVSTGLVQSMGVVSPTTSTLGEPLDLTSESEPEPQPARTSLEYEEQSHVPSLLSEHDPHGRHSWHANVVGRASGQEAGSEAIDNDADWAKEVKALFVIRELIQTERSYCRHLECLLDAVQRVLQRDSASASTTKRDTTHLTSLATLLPPLIGLSQKLVEYIERVPTAAGVGASFGLVADQLEATMIGWSFTIADVMTRLRATELGPGSRSSARRCPRVGMVEVPPDSFYPSHTYSTKYTTYGGKGGTVPPPSPQQASLYLADEARPRHNLHHQQVSARSHATSGAAAGAGPGPGRRKALSAMDIVIMPTQRLPRYLLLLRELQTHTPDGSAASNGLEGALRICGRVADLCDGASAGGGV